jgi:hypothetical protein
MVAFIVVILLKGGDYVQETISLSASRNFLLNYTARNSSLTFTTLNFNITGSNFTIYPSLYYEGVKITSSNLGVAEDVSDGMLNAINIAITGQKINSSQISGGCSGIGHYFYCVIIQ